MKKLLLAVGDRELAPATIDFACYLARLTRSKLTAIFLKHPDEEESASNDVEVGQTEKSEFVKIIQRPMAVTGYFAQQSERLIEACATREVICTTEMDRYSSFKELLSQTNFADALIIDSDFTLRAVTLEAFPSHAAKKVLHESGCPVIVAPLNFEQIDEIVFTYDGNKSSLLAIRQFIYLFPELADKKATVLQIWLEEDARAKDQEPLIEWLKIHFNNVESVIREGEPEPQLMEYNLLHPEAFLVMGGFGRGRASRMLQPSTSRPLLSFTSSPVFVAHS